jgi:transcriptional regulator of nitric oxide reductase
MPYLTLTAPGATITLSVSGQPSRISVVMDTAGEHTEAECRDHAEAIALAHRWRDELLAGRFPATQ